MTPSSDGIDETVPSPADIYCQIDLTEGVPWTTTSLMRR